MDMLLIWAIWTNLGDLDKKSRLFENFVRIAGTFCPNNQKQCSSGHELHTKGNPKAW